MALMANGLMRRPQTEAAEGAPYKLIDITAPNGKTISAAADGNAVVALDKVNVYARGGSPDVSDELAALQAFKQQSRKSFDADSTNQTRLDQLKNMQHNYERSQDMARLLDNIGLPSTPQNNEYIVSNLLKTGNTVTPDNRAWVPGRLDGPNGSLVVNSTWTILPDQTAYLSTLRFMPIRK
jgi:hypothetical protein